MVISRQISYLIIHSPIYYNNWNGENKTDGKRQAYVYGKIEHSSAWQK